MLSATTTTAGTPSSFAPLFLLVLPLLVITSFVALTSGSTAVPFFPSSSSSSSCCPYLSHTLECPGKAYSRAGRKRAASQDTRTTKGLRKQFQPNEISPHSPTAPSYSHATRVILGLRGGGQTLSAAYNSYGNYSTLSQWWTNATSLGEIDRYFMLAGDVGGTNARLAIFAATPQNLSDGSVSTEVYGRNYKVREFGSLAAILAQFLKDAEKDKAISLREYLQIKSRRYPTTACFAVAGPVDHNQVKFTNVKSWPVIRGSDLERQLGIQKVQLLNDFCALSEGVMAMEYRGLCDCMLLQKPTFFTPRRFKSNVLVIGAGTGLGECQLVWNGNHYQAWASEGGHADFSPQNEEQVLVREFLRRKYNLTQRGSAHISVERLCSGQGIEDIYEFFRSRYPGEVDSDADAEFERAIEKAVVVTEHGKRERGSLMNRALDMFLSIYGGEVGNAALKFLPFGGIYVGGGIAPNLKDYLERSNTFLNAIRDKGRMSHLVRQIPVKLILSKGIAIRGAETVARRKLQAFLDESSSAVAGAGYYDATPTWILRNFQSR